MPHPTQQAQQAISPAVMEFQHNGDRSSNGHRHSNRHVPTDGQGPPAPVEAEIHLADVSALLAENDDRDGAALREYDGQHPEPAMVDVGGRLMSTTDIRRLLDSRPVIDQAKGLLMGYYGIDADRAFNLLRRWSQTRNMRLASISARLVNAASAGSTEPFSCVRNVLDELNSGKGREIGTRQGCGHEVNAEDGPWSPSHDRLATIEELVSTLGVPLPADAVLHLVNWLDRRDRIFDKIATEQQAISLEAVAAELHAEAAGNQSPQTPGLILAARVLLDRAAETRAGECVTHRQRRWPTRSATPMTAARPATQRGHAPLPGACAGP